MNTTHLEEIKRYFKELKVPGVINELEYKIEEAYKEDKSYEELLIDILKDAYEVRKENGRQSRIRLARFPYLKYLNDLEREFLPKEAKSKLKELESLKFIEEKRNIILAGNPGTGKSHLAIGLGISAARKGFKVFFTGAIALINLLKERRSEKSLLSLEKKFEKYDLVIIDELGYISFDKEGSELLFNFISLRAERMSTIITTNLSFNRWTEVFGDPVLTAALIDRLTHKSYVIDMNGNSYRLKETKDWLNQS